MICELRPLQQYPFIINKETNVVELSYTMFADRNTCEMLDIVYHGWRWMSMEKVLQEEERERRSNQLKYEQGQLSRITDEAEKLQANLSQHNNLQDHILQKLVLIVYDPHLDNLHPSDLQTPTLYAPANILSWTNQKLIIPSKPSHIQHLSPSPPLIFHHTSQVIIIRKQLSLRTALLPDLPPLQTLYIYLSSCNDIPLNLITTVLTKHSWVVQPGIVLLDCLCLQPYTRQPTIPWQQRAELLSRIRQASHQPVSYRSYLSIYLQTRQQHHTAQLFIPSTTKLQVITDVLHWRPYYRLINLQSSLYRQVFDKHCYTRISQWLDRMDVLNSGIVLFTSNVKGEDMGIDVFLHIWLQQRYIRPRNSVNRINQKDNQSQSYIGQFLHIDCNTFASVQSLYAAILALHQYDSTLVYLTNIEWMLQVANSDSVSQTQLKHILQTIQNCFKQTCHHNIRKYILIIQLQQSNDNNPPISHNNQLQMIKKCSILNLIPSTIQQKQLLMLTMQDISDELLSFNITMNNINAIVESLVNKITWLQVHKFLLKYLPKLPLQLSEAKSSASSLSTITAFTLLQSQLTRLTRQQQVGSIATVTWQDIGGLQTAKQQIIQTILLPIHHPEIFDEWIRPRTGLLFYGPPGTGKTLLGKCIAKQCNMGFISVKGPQLLDMYVGESEKNIRRLFDKATNSRPCIIFLDQLDALVPRRGNGTDSSQIMDRIVAQLLLQMDTASSKQIFIIGATNRPDLLDPSIMRPGRFDKQIYLGISENTEERFNIMKALTRTLPIGEDVDLREIVEKLPKNFTGADCYGLTSKAVMRAVERCIAQCEINTQNIMDNHIQINTIPLSNPNPNPQNLQVTLIQSDFLQILPTIKPSVSHQQLNKYQQLRKIYT